MKILRKWWFSGTYGTIGVVAGEDTITGKRKAYIGTAPGYDEGLDAHHISQTGSPVVPTLLTEITEYLSGKLREV